MNFPAPKAMPSRELNQLYDPVRLRAEKLIKLCADAGIPIIVTQTFRTHKYQDELYARGRTMKGKIVTNAKAGTSMHEFRVAFDVCINIKGKCYDEGLLKKVGKIGESIGLTWGGNFKGFIDMPHFQYTGKYTQQEIRAGKIPT